MFLKKLTYSLILSTFCLSTLATAEEIVERPNAASSREKVFHKLGPQEIFGNNLVLKEIKAKGNDLKEIQNEKQVGYYGYELEGFSPKLKVEHKRVDYYYPKEEQYFDMLIYHQKISDSKDKWIPQCIEKQVQEISKSKTFEDVFENDMAKITLYDYRSSKVQQFPTKEAKFNPNSKNTSEKASFSVNLFKKKDGKVVCEITSAKKIDQVIESTSIEVSKESKVSSSNLHDLQRSEVSFAKGSQKNSTQAVKQAGSK